eukprot:XP_001189524.3 PREDICTED: uncharacterized protein LOC755357 [Strongylocentrotus purpuratus]
MKELESKEQQLERENWKLRTKIQLESEIRSTEQKKKAETRRSVFIPWVTSGKQDRGGTSSFEDNSTGELGINTTLQAGEEPPDDEFANILKKIADYLYDEAKIDSLAGQLGILQGDIQRALMTNVKTNRVTSDGTRHMLRQWRRGVSREDERIQLGNALRAAKLVNIADREEPPDDEFANILKKIADYLYDEAKIDSLAGQLGILQGDIQRALMTNVKTNRVTSDGTRHMLRQWRRGVSREDERIQLRNALRAAKLVNIADRYLKEDRTKGHTDTQVPQEATAGNDHTPRDGHTGHMASITQEDLTDGSRSQHPDKSLKRNTENLYASEDVSSGEVHAGEYIGEQSSSHEIQVLSKDMSEIAPLVSFGGKPNDKSTVRGSENLDASEVTYEDVSSEGSSCCCWWKFSRLWHHLCRSPLDPFNVELYWLEPTAAAMAKLDEIQFSVESMKPASAFNVQSVWSPASSTPPPSSPIGRSPSSSKASPYTELETEPPLSTVSIQKTSAWGSNTSIPDLIKAQGERQKKPKGAPRRPWSGRKVPSSPTLQRRGSQTGSGDDANKDTPGAFIAVKGAKSVMYDVGSRPPSGRSHPSSSSSSTAGPHNSSHDVFEMMEAANTARPTHGESATEGEDNALEEFLRSQPNGHKHELSKLSAAYADERNVTPPPPPPCASPDLEKLINGGLDEEDYYYADRDHPEVEGHKEEDRDSGELYIHVTQPSYVPPQLLRRPTPEPLKLSMTIPDAEGEEDYSTDEDRSSGAPSPQLSPDIEVQSVTSEVSAQLTAQYITSQRDSPSHTHPLTPQGVDSTITQDRVDEWDHREIDASAGKSRKGRQSS